MKQLIVCLVVCLVLVGCQMPGITREYTETRFVMDTICSIRAGGNQAKEAVQAALDLVQEIHGCVSLYDDASTVVRFNAAPAGEPVPIDSHTEAILITALEVSRSSEGAFDVTIAPVRRIWPFHGEENPVPPLKDAVAERLPMVDYRFLELDAVEHTLTKTRNGVEIDLGGAAKGYAADVARQLLEIKGMQYGLLDFGGNIAVFGENPKAQDGSWEIGIQSPFAKTGMYHQLVKLQGRASLVTSGTYQRCFTYENVLYHHILDPTTGYPAQTQADSISIQGESALVADCLSTACLVLSRGAAQALAEEYHTEIYFASSENRGAQ